MEKQKNSKLKRLVLIALALSAIGVVAVIFETPIITITACIVAGVVLFFATKEKSHQDAYAALQSMEENLAILKKIFGSRNCPTARTYSSQARRPSP